MGAQEPWGWIQTQVARACPCFNKTTNPCLPKPALTQAPVTQSPGTDPGEVKWVNFHLPPPPPFLNDADTQASNTSTRLWFFGTKIHPFQNPGSAPGAMNTTHLLRPEYHTVKLQPHVKAHALIATVNR